MDRLLRSVRFSQEPFGGIQVILVGDFFQLPPVSRGSDIDFAFENPAWRTFRLAICVLTVQYRQIGVPSLQRGMPEGQGDFVSEINPQSSTSFQTAPLQRSSQDPLLQILNEIRSGNVSQNSHELLRSRNIPVTTEDHTELFTRNVSVDSYNTDRLNQIQDDTFLFEMQSK